MSHGIPVPDDLVAPFRDSSTLLARPADLRRRLSEDGHLFLRDVLPVEDVRRAQRAVLAHLATVGEVAEPVAAGRFSGASRRKELAPDLGGFWRAICEHPDVRAVSHGERLRQIVETALGCPALGQDFLYLRAGVRGRATQLHYDYPFFAKTTERTLTLWVAVGDVPVEAGPLAVVAGSNRYDDLIAKAKAYGGGYGAKAALDEPMHDFVRARGTALLTENFRAGDMAILDMFTLHGSLDNHSDLIRVSFDVRYQPAQDPRDERYFGAPPPGMTGRSYGELNGAKPLTEDWHQR